MAECKIHKIGIELISMKEGCEICYETEKAVLAEKKRMLGEAMNIHRKYCASCYNLKSDPVPRACKEYIELGSLHQKEVDEK